MTCVIRRLVSTCSIILTISEKVRTKSNVVCILKLIFAVQTSDM